MTARIEKAQNGLKTAQELDPFSQQALTRLQDGRYVGQGAAVRGLGDSPWNLRELVLCTQRRDFTNLQEMSWPDLTSKVVGGTSLLSILRRSRLASVTPTRRSDCSSRQ